MHRFVLLAAVAALASGCGAPKPGAVPNVRYGTDVCGRCGMIVSEERFAAGYVGTDGVVVAFDDIGEWLETTIAQPGTPAVTWVHDAGSGTWVKAAEAVYVRIPGLATPMGSGVAAFASEAAARTFAAKFGATPAFWNAAEAARALAAGKP